MSYDTNNEAIHEAPACVQESALFLTETSGGKVWQAVLVPVNYLLLGRTLGVRGRDKVLRANCCDPWSMRAGVEMVQEAAACGPPRAPEEHEPA